MVSSIVEGGSCVATWFALPEFHFRYGWFDKSYAETHA